MDDWYDPKIQEKAERIKWDFRQKELNDLWKRWAEEDVKEDQARRDFEASRKSQNFLAPDPPQFRQGFLSDVERREIERQVEADRIKQEVRLKFVDDLKKAWLEADIREAEQKAESEQRFRRLQNNQDFF